MNEVLKKLLLLLLAGLVVLFAGGCSTGKEKETGLRIAVEFVDHAACAHIARNQGWYEREGINVIAFDNYLTGPALASAIARGDVDAAYICLVPAINTFANGKVPIRIVAGTHKYGYGLVVAPDRIESVADLEKPGVRIGCPSEGTTLDLLLHKMIDEYRLDGDKVLNNVQRMPFHKIFLALKTGQLDAGFLPEQFSSMAEELGFNELLSARDLWPGMQGSVLVVRKELIESNPELVEKLVELTRRGIRYINDHPEEAAAIVADELTVAGKEALPVDITERVDGLEVTPEVILRSLTTKMEFTADVDPQAVQQVIDYLAELGYIERFDAARILDVRFLAGR